MIARLTTFARMVKLEHSVFALPFAYIGLFLASEGKPGWSVFLLLTLAMVAVRTFAMGANRLLDLDIDRQNPRTQTRPLVTGEISFGHTLAFTFASAAIFVLACSGLNQLCLILSPLALIWAGLYSLSKRFTWLSHFWLGSVLGLAPIGGWLAYDPVFTLPAVLFFLGVTFWVAGFDILYACQDTSFDAQAGLHSIPSRFGLVEAMHLSSFCHVNAGLFFGLAGWSAGLGAVYGLCWLLMAGILFWEHLMVGPDNLERLDTAFFTLNGVVSVLLFGGVVWEMLLH